MTWETTICVAVESTREAIKRPHLIRIPGVDELLYLVKILQEGVDKDSLWLYDKFYNGFISADLSRSVSLPRPVWTLVINKDKATWAIYDGVDVTYRPVLYQVLSREIPDDITDQTLHADALDAVKYIQFLDSIINEAVRLIQPSFSHIAASDLA